MLFCLCKARKCTRACVSGCVWCSLCKIVAHHSLNQPYHTPNRHLFIATTPINDRSSVVIIIIINIRDSINATTCLGLRFGKNPLQLSPSCKQVSCISFLSLLVLLVVVVVVVVLLSIAMALVVGDTVVAEGVAKALIMAQEAVENDVEKEYVLAVQCYQDAVAHILDISSALPTHLAKALSEKVCTATTTATTTAVGVVPRLVLTCRPMTGNFVLGTRTTTTRGTVWNPTTCCCYCLLILVLMVTLQYFVGRRP
jgi:type II secretory pathway pseudopilin PulG